MKGVLRALSRAHGLITAVAVALALALLAGVAGEAAAAGRPSLSEDGADRRPGAQKTPRIKGKRLKVRPGKPPGTAGTPISGKPPSPVWPKPGQGIAVLSKLRPGASGQDGRAAGVWVRAGKLPVWAGAPPTRRGERSAAPGVPERVQVKMADRKTAKATRAEAVMSLSAPQAGNVRVGLSYTEFKNAHGGDWASRLRLVKLPACALNTPEQTRCQQRTVLPTVNDTKTATLSADVSVAAEPAQNATGTAGTATVLAVEAGPSGPSGDWGATSLSPASNWTAGSNTGEFSWSYPMRLPPVPGELMPEVTIGYNSGAVDGKTAADNSQASWIGDGFDYWPGYIERKYKPCIDAGHASGDLCWGRQNAVLSLNGRSTELLYDSTAQTWRPRNDDGSTIERLTGATNGDNDGEYWKLTDLDGVEYYFGVNRPDDWKSGEKETDSAWTVPVFGDGSSEPCYDSNFKDAWCQQAWRWNLDHVVDPHNNTITYYYGKETNNYTRYQQTSGGTRYDSGGYLSRIDYGQRKGSSYATPATGRVRFTLSDRTDLPDDRICDDGDTCGYAKTSPTFFNRKRLTKITTKLRNNQVVSTEDPGYATVDIWDLGQTYQNGALWLHTIDQTGHDGGETKAPRITLFGQLMTNRVVTGRSGTGVDALPGYDRPRLVGIDNGTGATTSVGYSDPYADPTPAGDCVYSAGNMPDPKHNTKRCFPVKWEQPDGKLINDWYHKYVVGYIIEADNTGQSRSQITSYGYLGDAAWRYAEDDGMTKDKWRTWSHWRGYTKVRTVTGDGQNGEQQSRTETTYARGMDGNYQGKGNARESVTVSDSKNLLGGISDLDPLAGAVLETRTFNGAFTDAAETEASVSRPKWTKTISRTFHDTNSDDDITVDGGRVQPQWTRGRSRKADGTDFNTQTTYDYDSLGRTVAVDNEGDITTSADDTCSRTVFPSGTAPAGAIQTLPVRTLSVAVDCDNDASHEPNLVPADMISDAKIIYDGKGYGAYPTVGNATSAEKVTGVSGGRSTMTTAGTTTYDGYGRVLQTTQVGDPATTGDDRTTKSTYTDAAEGWLKSSTLTTPPVSVGGAAPAGFTTTIEYNPARGMPTKITDPNGRVGEGQYDGLGRLVRAWLPNNTRNSNPDRPSTTYAYAFPADGNPVSVTTKTLTKTNPVTYETSVDLLDGMLRPRQSQNEAAGGGRTITDTKYDSRGLVYKTNAAYVLTGNPSGVLTTADDNQVPSQTLSTYDGAERVLTTTLYSFSTKKWATTNQYDGERTTVIPPSGAMPSATLTDALSRTVETRQYKTANLTGTYLATTVAYDGAGRPAESRDAAGNLWKSTYDVQGRPVTSSSPDKGASTVTYDFFDQVSTAKDGRGTTLGYRYDNLGRPLEVKNGTTPLTSMTYDTVPYAKGLPATSTRHIGDDKYVTAITGYDGLYNAKGTTVTIPASEGALAGTYTTTQSYNFNGSPLTTSYPAVGGSTGLPAEDVTTEYNDDGLPEWTHGLATYVADTVYDGHGDITQLAMASVSDKFLWQTFDRDPATNRLTRSTVKRQSSTATFDLETKYDYTDAGSIRSILTNAAGKSPDRQCFTYDYAQRLSEAWSTTNSDCNVAPTATTIGGPAPYWTSYQYDATGNYGDKVGNRTNEVQHAFTGGPTADKTRTSTYPAPLGDSGLNSPHALKSLSETDGTTETTDLYTYDQVGNTITRPGQKLVWDAEGNLSKVTDDAGKELASYIYDAAGNRLIRKDTNGKTLYLPSQEVKVSPSGTITAVRYYSHAGQNVAYRTGTSSSTVQFVVPDYQGSADTTVNAVDQDNWSVRRFAPFGNERSSPIGLWPTLMDKGYVGGTKDTTTGLTHLGAREYDPVTGRFLSADPVTGGGDPLTANGYSYAGNNPVDHADPTGQYRDGGFRVPGSAYGNDGPRERWDNANQHRNSFRRGGGGGVYLAPPRAPSGGGCWVGCNGTVSANPVPVKKPCGWSCKVGKVGGFLKKHQATIAGIAAGGLCAAATGGTAVVGCAAIGGWVYGVVSYHQNTPSDQQTLVGGFKAGLTGAAIDAGLAVSGLLAAKAAAPVLRRVAPKIVQKVAGRAKGGAPGRGGSAAKTAPAAAKKAGKAAADAPVAGGAKVPCNSFVPTAHVLMGDGSSKPIDKIKVGDMVLATDPSTGKTAPQPVLSTITRSGAKHLVQLTVDTDGNHGGKTGALIATDNHPFWVPAAGKWIDAGKLKPGMWLRTSAGTHVQLTATKAWTQYQRVRNLTVDTYHTYYVEAGTTPLLVHNCEGVAVVHVHSLPGNPLHFTIETMGPEGSVIHSNLMPSFDKMQTPISHWTGGSSPVQLTFRLPNGDAAIAFQRSLIGTEQGPYDLARNSCLTHVCDVLREGGVDDIPTNGLFRWARNGLNSAYREDG
ncbi:polymorphic toxin-type HINT domain-containing protein [Actinomadura sp. NPDC023710]|uniref:polymorphic toxin-type HINT domain-containing protein n=1 Tax=Actinomadura sp. NPDC023710 TaxID=3158219 RepID=UPI0033F0DE44